MRLFRFMAVILVFTLVMILAINPNIKTSIGVFAISKPLSAAPLPTTKNRVQLENRLNQLKAEYKAGEKMLAELEAKEASVRDTLTRINGAIQTIEEELGEGG